MEYARRRCGGSVGGQGFDSPHLHSTKRPDRATCPVRPFRVPGPRPAASRTASAANPGACVAVRLLCSPARPASPSTDGAPAAARSAAPRSETEANMRGLLIGLLALAGASIPSGARAQATIAESINRYHPGCHTRADMRGGDCVAAAHRYCEANQSRNSFGFPIRRDTENIHVACAFRAWYGDVAYGEAAAAPPRLPGPRRRPDAGLRGRRAAVLREREVVVGRPGPGGRTRECRDRLLPGDPPGRRGVPEAPRELRRLQRPGRGGLAELCHGQRRVVPAGQPKRVGPAPGGGPRLARGVVLPGHGAGDAGALTPDPAETSGLGHAPGCAGVGLRLRSKRYYRLQRRRAPTVLLFGLAASRSHPSRDSPRAPHHRHGQPSPGPDLHGSRTSGDAPPTLEPADARRGAPATRGGSRFSPMPIRAVPALRALQGRRGGVARPVNVPTAYLGQELPTGMPHARPWPGAAGTVAPRMFSGILLSSRGLMPGVAARARGGHRRCPRYRAVPRPRTRPWTAGTGGRLDDGGPSRGTAPPFRMHRPQVADDPGRFDGCSPLRVRGPGAAPRRGPAPAPRRGRHRGVPVPGGAGVQPGTARRDGGGGHRRRAGGGGGAGAARAARRAPAGHGDRGRAAGGARRPRGTPGGAGGRARHRGDGGGGAPLRGGRGCGLRLPRRLAGRPGGDARLGGARRAGVLADHRGLALPPGGRALRPPRGPRARPPHPARARDRRADRAGALQQGDLPPARRSGCPRSRTTSTTCWKSSRCRDAPPPPPACAAWKPTPGQGGRSRPRARV